MKLNRRSVLGLIGTVGIGSGAAFGSGAFSSVSATREVEVNVVGVDGSNGDEIAAKFTDVLVDASAPEVALRDSNSNLVTDPKTLFPTTNDSLTTDSDTSISTDYVSLIANDVSVVFGYDNSGGGSGSDERLMPNSTYEYPSGFFKLVNNSGSSSTDFDVELSTPGGLLTNINDGNGNSGNPYSETISAGSVSDLSVTLQTGDSSRDTEDLTITIN